MRSAAPPNTLAAMLKERRTEPREDVELAVRLPDGERTVTRNVSSSGLYFETERDTQLGETVDLEIELDTDWGQLALQTRAEVVHLERGTPRHRIGARFLDSRLAALD